MGLAQPGLGLNFPSYNRGGHTWETSPLAPGQPFSRVQVCECVKRAGSAQLPASEFVTGCQTGFRRGQVLACVLMGLS